MKQALEHNKVLHLFLTHLQLKKEENEILSCFFHSSSPLEHTSRNNGPATTCQTVPSKGEVRWNLSDLLVVAVWVRTKEQHF